MVRYTLLLKWTDRGIAEVKNSLERAAAFRAAAAKVGAEVEKQYWTLGEYDGLVIFTAPDESAGVALAVELGRLGFVRTCMQRALDADEFQETLAKL